MKPVKLIDLAHVTGGAALRAQVAQGPLSPNSKPQIPSRFSGSASDLVINAVNAGMPVHAAPALIEALSSSGAFRPGR